MIERQILRALLARKVEGGIADFVKEHAETIRKLKMEPEEVKNLIWKLLGEAAELRQNMMKMA
jgi:type III secretory pathway component EscU